MNKIGSAVDMLTWQKEQTVSLEKAASLPPHVLEDKIITGVFVKKLQPEYTALYRNIHDRCWEDDGK